MSLGMVVSIGIGTPGPDATNLFRFALLSSFFLRVVVLDVCLGQEADGQVWGGPDGCGRVDGYRSADDESQAHQVHTRPQL